MSDQFAPGAPEDDPDWTGGARSDGVTPARGDAAGALAASGPPPSSTPTAGDGPPSPYAPGAGGNAAEGKRAGAGKRRSRTTRTRKPRTRGPSRPVPPRIATPAFWVWMVVGVVVLLAVAKGCAGIVGNNGSTGSRGAGSSAAPAVRTVDPTPAPSVSALRGSPLSGVPAPELISQSDLPEGAGYSPLAPAPGREVSVRFQDRYEGRSQVFTLSTLSTDDSTVPSYYRDDFYPDEVWRTVKVHVAPEGYGEDDYAQEPVLRLQGESGRWYEGDCFEFGFDDWVPTTRTFAFSVPRWDLPTRPVVEINGDPYQRFSFPVYVDVS